MGRLNKNGYDKSKALIDLFLGCRAGYIKLWSVESCALQGEMKAHNSTINTITTNNNHVFTGSNDGSIGMWRVRNHFDKSPDSEMSSSS